MYIQIFGSGRRLEECRRRLLGAQKKSPYDRLVVLPIPTTRDGIHISGTDTTLAEALSGACRGTLVAGYGIPPATARRIILQGAQVYDAAEDEDFLMKNAEITARGALGEILLMTDRDLRDLTIGVVGYGRIGSALVRLLLFLGAGVRVYSRRFATRLELSARGLISEAAPDAGNLRGLDILVNTAPAILFSDEEFAALPDGLRIIDLASGKNFPTSERVVKLPSIPERNYPVTAGGVYAEFIARRLFDGGEAR